MTDIKIHVSEWIQVGHRLVNLPGKCQQIHGHSMHVTLHLQGPTDDNGYIIDEEGFVLDFSEVKKHFRALLNESYDHHLLLNKDDWYARQILPKDNGFDGYLPGLTQVPGDPSTENIAKWVYEAMAAIFGVRVRGVVIEETATNGVRYPA
jgi:6-pyruvoyltetrahydropterin/6-carboxytetrahydropterin synthase